MVLRNKKILIMDREPDIRKTLETLLSKKRYHTRSTAGGKEAMDILKSEPFDLVIMDINMPGTNGLQVIRNIKKLEEGIEVIVLTGLNTIDNAVQALRHNGAFDFLIKPLENGDKLINSVEKALQKQRTNKKGTIMFRVFITALLIISLFSGVVTDGVLAENEVVKIGVLAKRGPERCIEKWSPTAEYLSNKIPEITFQIVPVDFDQIYSVVEKSEVDFILANPSFYVELENWYGISRIATLKNKVITGIYTKYRGVVFCKKQRKDIRQYSDLKGKTFMAVKETSFGGWRMAWRELKEAGINPFKDFASMNFGGTHDAVVYAVRDGKVDAGTVRTDTLERMNAEGKISIDDFYVIHAHGGENVHLPFLHSSREYPEWLIAKLKQTSNEVAEKVAVALIGIPQDSAAAQAARCAGWTIPLNYQSVHDCLKELKVGPYKDLGKITLTDVFRKYWILILINFATLVVLVWFLNAHIKHSRKLKTTHGELQSEVDERINAEESLRKTRDYLDNLFNNASAPIIVWDPETRITRFNHAFEHLTGHTSDEVVGQKLQMLFPESSRDELLLKIVTLSGEFWQSVEIPIFCKDSDVRTVLWNSAYIYAEDGVTTIATIAQGIDITERKLSEERINHLNTVLRAIRNINLLIVTEKDRERLIQRACANFTATRGYYNSWIALFDESGNFISAAEAEVGERFSQLQEIFKSGDLVTCGRKVPGQPGVLVIHNPAEACKDCPLTKNYAGRAAMSIRLEHADKVYGIMTVSLPGRMATDSQEQSLFEEVAKDIAFALHAIEAEVKKKESQEALRRSEEFNKTIIESSIDCIKILDLDGRLEFMSPGGQKLLEIEDIGPYLGQSWIDFWKGPDHKAALEAVSKAQDGYTDQFQGFCPSEKGTEKWWDVIVTPIIGKDGGVERLLAVSRDISSQKTIEEQFRQAQKMEAIGTLAGGVAHDFNNILTTIIGNANLALMEAGKNDTLREEIEEIKISGERAASLTRQLLAFSRKQVIKPEVLDINKVINETEKMLKRMIGEDIEFQTVLKPELWKVHIDSGQIDRMIINMAVNARDAMPQGGKLIVETANVDLDKNYLSEHGIEGSPSHYVMLAISDTGSGMNKETRKHIFEPFFTTKELGKGTGLGLSTVYGIAKQNNGFIWVYSEPGQGTTFKIYLPKVKEGVEPEEKERIHVEDLNGSETVLIVEDDDRLRNLAQKILERYGYSVLEAENGEDALRVSEEYEGSIHLMLTDVVMPKMSGKETAERLQPLYPQMKVIYMSGYTDNAIVHHGVLAPGLNFIEKPFTPEGLAHKVRGDTEYRMIDTIQLN